MVKILKKPKGHIKLTKLTEQPKPPQLDLIKQEVFRKWPAVSLLDILKETDLFVNFIDLKQALSHRIINDRMEKYESYIVFISK